MTTGSLLLALALLILVVLFVARPFLLPPERPPRLTKRAALLAQKEALLAQIKALDFDAQTGKLPPDDYAAERERLLQTATTVMQQLDAADDVDAEIEAAVRRLRASRPAAAANFCPQCGSPTDTADKFCAQCGHKLV